MDHISFIREIGSFRSDIHEPPSWLKLTTITMVSSHLKDTSCKLNLNRMKLFFKKARYVPISFKGGSIEYKWRRFYSTFYNQVTIGYQDSLSTKKVKIFPNGSLQIAGCRDITDCDRFIKQLNIIMKLVYEVEIPKQSFRIVMINSNFSLNHMINQNMVFSIFTKIKGVSVSFDPDRYSAVKLKFKPIKNGKTVTVSIFSSGSVIITGAQTLDEVCQAYIFLISHMLMNIDKVYVAPSEEPKYFDYFMYYTYSEWFEKIISDDNKNVIETRDG